MRYSMAEESQNEVLTIIEYVKSANLKGSVEINRESFWWNLGDVTLVFYLGDGETIVEYYHSKHIRFNLGHLHVNTSDLMKFIQDINCENKMVKISVFIPLLISKLTIVNKTVGKKRSGLFVRRYYSI